MSGESATVASSSRQHPAYLDPSELGTKEYWDAYYITEQQNALSVSANGIPDQDFSALPTWFEDVNAPQKILNFLLSSHFPLSPNYSGDKPPEPPLVLDVGTGNGRTLFQLRDGKMEGSYSESETDSDLDQGSDGGDGIDARTPSAHAASTKSVKVSLGYTGPMYGIDYSVPSILLANTLCARSPNYEDIHFHTMDVLADNAESMSWWPRSTDDGTKKHFDLIIDKGTFDAISLSQHPMPDSRIPHPSKVYPRRVGLLLKLGGFLLITSCNWTEDELIDWFTPCAQANSQGWQGAAPANDESCTTPVLEVFDKIRYPTFRFGGKEGAGVASVCFKRVN